MDKDWLLIIVLGIGWGTSFFFNEVLLREMGPLMVSFARVTMAALFCWGWVLISGRKPLSAFRMAPQMAVMGVAMFAIPFAVYPIGQQYVASGVAGIVNAMTPVMVVIVSHFWPDGEKATFLKSLGILSGFTGIVLLSLRAVTDGDPSSLYGTVLILLAPISYAFAMNYVRRLHKIDIAVMLAWAFSFAAIAVLPVALIWDGWPPVISMSTWGAIAFLGCVLTGLSFLIAFQILPRAGATKTSSVTFIAPVSALLIGYFVLQEELGLLHLAGMAAIFLGLMLIDGRLFKRSAPA
jgi:drug/metabolite transporter (DMT)-like permease